MFKKARKYFESENYQAALDEYIRISSKFSDELVQFNMRLCRRKIQEALGYPAGELDGVTQLLLHNSGRKSLSESTLQELLAKVQSTHSIRSEDVETKPVNPVPSDWPEGLELAPLPESTNDYKWARLSEDEAFSFTPRLTGLSIVVPTFNRLNILDITLACLLHQKTEYKYEVIVADDGSSEDVLSIVRQYENRLDINYVRQPDKGYQLCAIRNLGIRAAKYDYVAILDCDMAPNRAWVQSYMNLLLENSQVALIGPRKYVDTNGMSASEFLADPDLLDRLPEVVTNNSVAGRTCGEISVDWRLWHFETTDNLRLCDDPFRYFSGGNVAFAKYWVEKAGYFDEEFNHWGGEDNEFGYRLYKHGCFFRSVPGGMAYHQEPPGRENETDRAAGKAVTIKLVEQKVPYFYRKLEPIKTAKIKQVPLVSIYIPAYNCERFITQAVDSALNQTVPDLEVVVCDDGSTDNTSNILAEHYRDNPRVRVVSQENGGIGAASNTAVRACRGYYIGQLDSDDYLEPDAVEICLKEFFNDKKLACVYTTNRNVDAQGNLITNGYNWPEFSREKFSTAMIVHHFRMFTARAWYLTSGFDEEITNAVDYDMYLKLSEVGKFKHVNKIAYNRVLHGDNTSIKKLDLQKRNHFSVVGKYLERQGCKNWKYRPVNHEDPACRKYFFSPPEAELTEDV